MSQTATLPPLALPFDPQLDRLLIKVARRADELTAAQTASGQAHDLEVWRRAEAEFLAALGPEAFGIRASNGPNASADQERSE